MSELRVTHRQALYATVPDPLTSAVRVAQQYIIVPVVPPPAEVQIAQQYAILDTVPPPAQAQVGQQYIIVMIKNRKPRTRPQVYG